MCIEIVCSLSTLNHALIFVFGSETVVKRLLHNGRRRFGFRELSTIEKAASHAFAAAALHASTSFTSSHTSLQ